MANLIDYLPHFPDAVGFIHIQSVVRSERSHSRIAEAELLMQHIGAVLDAFVCQYGRDSHTPNLVFHSCKKILTLVTVIGQIPTAGTKPNRLPQKRVNENFGAVYIPFFF